MINNQPSKLLLLTVLIWGLHSCAVDDMTIEKSDIIFPDPVEILATSIFGSLEDEVGQPVADALVICSNCLPSQSTLSDEQGDFQFLNVEVKGQSGYLTVESEGKYDAFRRIGLLEGHNNYTRIMMRDQLSLGRLLADQGGQLAHATGASISLPANGIVDDNGQAYSGEYEIFMSWIDPSAEDLNLRMVGDLSAIAADGEVVGLSTYGMLQVELEALDGMALNLKDGATATLEFPVPAVMKATAPSVIPLWSYNEENGYWVEEGQAFLVDDKYIGEVTHFSSWNVDIKIDPVDICGSIKVVYKSKEVALPYFQVKLTGDSFQSVGGWLCEDGSFRFLNVPSGETIILDVYNYCGELIESIELGPFESGKVELDPLVIAEQTALEFIEISGNAVDCEGLPVSDGCISIDLEFDSYIFPLEADGSFVSSFPSCGEFEASIQVLNKAGFTLSLPVILTEESTDLTLDDIEVCGEEPEEYFYYTFTEYINSRSTRTEFVYDEELLSYYYEDSVPWDLRYILTSYKNGIGNENVDGIQFSVRMIPQIGVSESTDALVIFYDDSLEYHFEYAIKVEFTELGAEFAPGKFDFIEGHFVSINSGAEIEGRFRLKIE